jgi:hypothetical protein
VQRGSWSFSTVVLQLGLHARHRWEAQQCTVSLPRTPTAQCNSQKQAVGPSSARRRGSCLLVLRHLEGGLASGALRALLAEDGQAHGAHEALQPHSEGPCAQRAESWSLSLSLSLSQVSSELPPVTRSPATVERGYSDAKVANRNVRDFGWEMRSLGRRFPSTRL